MKRVAKIIGLVLLGLAVVYLLGANLFLNTPLRDSLINRKPEKLLVEWESGWTVLPGVVHVEDLRIRGQSKKKQWECRLDEGTFHLSLWALPGKVVRINRGRGSGFDFRIRRRLDRDEADLKAAEHLPPIEGLSNPPDPAPEDVYPPPDKDRRKWYLDISDIELRGPAGLWFGRFHATGRGLLGGGVQHRLGEDLEIPEAVLDLDDGVFQIDGSTLLENLAIDVEARLEPFDPKEVQSTDVMQDFFGSIHLEDGSVPDLSVLNAFLPAGDLGLEGGPATFRLDVVKEEPEKARGDFDLALPGARLVMANGAVTGDLDFTAHFDGGNLAQGVFELDEATLSLKNVRGAGALEEATDEDEEKPAGGETATQGEGWWATFTVEQGTIDLGRPTAIDLVAEFETKSSDPLVRFFFAKKGDGEQGLQIPGWVELLPTIEDLSGHVSLDLDDRGIVVDDLEVEGEDLEMLGRLASSKGKLRGQLYIHYKLLHLGIGLEGGDKSIHLSKPKQWFLAQPELDDTISLDISPDGSDDG